MPRLVCHTGVPCDDGLKPILDALSLVIIIICLILSRSRFASHNKKHLSCGFRKNQDSVCVCVSVCLGPSLRGVSAKSRCRTPTLLAQQGVGTVDLTRPVRRAVSRHSESGGRSREVMATPLRTDLMGISRLTCQRDMVSHTV